jgi:hypothetical protein
MFAWGVAVALVVAVLSVFLAGRLLMESCRRGRTTRMLPG